MGRPTESLLDRRRVVTKAIEIIDAEGLAALSMPRLARDLDVKAPSLYHHFADRADIMAEVARRIILEVPVPRQRDPDDWMERFIAFAINFRRTVLRHPNAAPILLEFLPRDLLRARYDEAAELLENAGVPAHVRVLILDGVETLTLGSALTHAMKPPRTRNKIFGHLQPDSEPALAQAVDANAWRTAEELFAESLRAFLHGATQAEPSGAAVSNGARRGGQDTARRRRADSEQRPATRPAS